MNHLMVVIALSYLALHSVARNQPLVALAFVLILFFYITNAFAILKAIAKIIFAKKPKRITKIEEGFQVTNVEMEKGIDYLRSEHPDKNDAEILQIREKEIKQILNEATRKFDKSKYDKHFKLTMFYNFEKEKKLITRFEPKTPFANSFLIKIMNIKMGQDTYYETDAE